MPTVLQRFCESIICSLPAAGSTLTSFCMQSDNCQEGDEEGRDASGESTLIKAPSGGTSADLHVLGG